MIPGASGGSSENALESDLPRHKEKTGRRVAFFGFRSGNQAISHVMLNLMNAMVDQGVSVDLLLNKTDIPELSRVRPEIRIVELGHGSVWYRVRALARYLEEDEPQVLYTNHKERANREAIFAKKMTGSGVHLVFRIGTTLSKALERRNAPKRFLMRTSVNYCYRRADTIIANARGVAADVSAITGIPLEEIHVVNNSTVTPTLYERALEPLDHPWLQGDGVPVVVGVGRMTRQKDFPTLFRAFARIRATRSCRLLILGEGKERGRLEQLARELGIEADLDMPGFVANPFAYMSRASLFVLSSAWEGSPNVLIEALALGIPAVATDCHSGPRDILQGGKYGPLVPVGDVDALTEAMLAGMTRPHPAEFLKRAAEPFHADRCAGEYLAAAGSAVAEEIF